MQPPHCGGEYRWEGHSKECFPQMSMTDDRKVQEGKALAVAAAPVLE